MTQDPTTSSPDTGAEIQPVHNEKRALVTGASRGIGKAIAVELADAGYNVAIAARTLRQGQQTLEHSQSIRKQDNRPLPGSLEETAQLISDRGREVLPVAMDLTDRASVEAAIGVVLDTWGGVDLVINNGRHIGPGLMDTILDTPLDEYAKFIDAHATNPIRIAQLLLPGMLDRGHGCFITITSGAGYEFYPRNAPGAAGVGLGYRIGKAAGHTLVGSILAEHANAGIRAFNLNPGFVATERNSLDAKELGFDPAAAAPPAVVAAVVAWMATKPEADALMFQNNDAQSIALERNLHPDWRRPA
jgi:NAD(P)-dependent dehydrogenase (short-subunit alcohol dehydrogenase family)